MCIFGFLFFQLNTNFSTFTFTSINFPSFLSPPPQCVSRTVITSFCISLFPSCYPFFFFFYKSFYLLPKFYPSTSINPLHKIPFPWFFPSFHQSNSNTTSYSRGSCKQFLSLFITQFLATWIKKKKKGKCIPLSTYLLVSQVTSSGCFTFHPLWRGPTTLYIHPPAITSHPSSSNPTTLYIHPPAIPYYLFSSNPIQRILINDKKPYILSWPFFIITNYTYQRNFNFLSQWCFMR